MADSLDLNGFDMVLALTQNAVNAQFETLYNEGLVDPARAIMPPQVDWETDTGTINAQLGPATVSFMPPNSNYQNATFILPLTSGTFDEYVVNRGPPPKVDTVSHKIDGWTVAFTVDLKKMAFGTAAQTGANAGGALSDAAHAKLADYPDDLFDVTALVYDFASANIAAFDQNHTYLPGLQPASKTNLANALTTYFKSERQQPFIVAIHASSKNPSATASAVQPTLVPTGVAYTTFGNASSYTPAGPPAGISTLNYLTSTGGDSPPPAQPNGIFTTPFVTDDTASGQLLISRALFVENFLLSKLGQKLGAAFQESNPLTWVSSDPNGPVVAYSKEGTLSSPGSIHSSGNTTTTTTATLSTSLPEIDITGTIATYADFKITFLWSGTWKTWRNIDFTGKIAIAASQDGHSLAVTFNGFGFGGAYKPRPDQENTGANVDNILSLGTLDGAVSAVLDAVTSQMEGWERSGSVLSAGGAAVPGVFVPLTGADYSLTPLRFNVSGDLVIAVNIETAVAAGGGGESVKMASGVKDDLTKVKGIGSVYSGRLEHLGINSFGELAAAARDEVAQRIKTSPKRVAKWISQAKDLAKS